MVTNDRTLLYGLSTALPVSMASAQDCLRTLAANHALARASLRAYNRIQDHSAEGGRFMTVVCTAPAGPAEA